MEQIKLHDIPEQYYEIAEFLGLDLFIAFCDYFGGSHIYIPTIKTLDKISRDREVIKLYEAGTDIKSLSRKYNVTSNCIRKIIKSKKVV